MHFRSLDRDGADEGQVIRCPGLRGFDATFDCPNADARRSDVRFDWADANVPCSNDEFSLGPSTL